jgi:hypothetical protein
MPVTKYFRRIFSISGCTHTHVCVCVCVYVCVCVQHARKAEGPAAPVDTSACIAEISLFLICSVNSHSILQFVLDSSLSSNLKVVLFYNLKSDCQQAYTKLCLLRTA